MPTLRMRLTGSEDDTRAVINLLQSLDGIEHVEEVGDMMAHMDDADSSSAGLSDIAGPDAIFRVDSFEGQQLPPKAQIKSIHVTRDQFAAETEQPGSTFVDVITQPGIGPVRGTGNLSFRDGSMSARNQFTPTKGPEQVRNYGVNVGGALVTQKSNFSLSVNGQSQYSTPKEIIPTQPSAPEWTWPMTQLV